MQSLVFYMLGASMGVLATLAYKHVTCKPPAKQYRKIHRVKFKTKAGTDEVSEIYGLY